MGINDNLLIGNKPSLYGSMELNPNDVVVIFHDPFEFGGFLKEYRERRGMSISQMARLTDVSGNALRFWESRERIPSLNSVHIVMKKLGVTKVIIDLGGKS